MAEDQAKFSYLDDYITRYDFRSRFLFTLASALVLVSLYFFRLLLQSHPDRFPEFIFVAVIFAVIFVSSWSRRIGQMAVGRVLPSIDRSSPGIYALAAISRIFRMKGMSANQKFQTFPQLLGYLLGIALSIWIWFHVRGLLSVLPIFIAIYYLFSAGILFLLVWHRRLPVQLIESNISGPVRELISYAREKNLPVPTLAPYEPWFGPIEPASGGADTGEGDNDDEGDDEVSRYVFNAVRYRLGDRSDFSEEEIRVYRRISLFMTIMRGLYMFAPFAVATLLFSLWLESSSWILSKEILWVSRISFTALFTTFSFLLFYQIVVVLFRDNTRKLYEEISGRASFGVIDGGTVHILSDIVEMSRDQIYQPKDIAELMRLSLFDELRKLDSFDSMSSIS